MPDITDEQLSLALSGIELRELGLLKWGILDSSMTRNEVDGAVAKSFEQPAKQGSSVDDHSHEPLGDPAVVVDRLCELGLIVRPPDGGYRSRMAETVRMLARLRNLKRSEPTWEGVPLVNDYRIEHRPRSRPARDLPGAQLTDTAPEGSGPQVTESLQVLAPEWVSGFQERSTEEVLRRLQLGSSAGVMVAAGTGSGKTHAFYLPALSWLVGELSQQPDAGVRILAIYPRGELLKDQFANTLKLTLRLRESDIGARPVRIGAWFGPTPKWSGSLPSGFSQSWKKIRKQGADFSWSCPFLGCPKCDAPSLEWLRTDVDAGIERLVCPKCEFELDSDSVALTRQGLKERPVDILFTTTESLNRQLADPEYHPAFGLVGDQRARVVLLDEVHTYGGLSGAQNAYLMRRLKSAIPGPLLWAGLSATLENPKTFFANLVGLSEHQVTVVEPWPDELIESGAEYLIALQHDAVYPTGHLSTTIQTTMALTRCLDPKPDPFVQSVDSKGLFGTKSFVFTDKMDVTNRLLDYLNDSEGWRWEGQLAQRRVLTLAHLRSRGQSRRPPDDREDHVEREPLGQWWWLPEHLGHDLDGDAQLIVSRTTSQDVGVNRDADVIVATASLEVGYDDEGVGAVVQHSAPHDSARFLQRKGRAGRDPRMRPWTVVVLADGGRDRVAWQTYDQLFDPRLNPLVLPMANRHVQRMQATYATLDWLGRRLDAVTPYDRSSWVDLTGPAHVVWHNNPKKIPFLQRRQEEASRVLREVLQGGPAREDLTVYLKRVLGFAGLIRGEQDLDALLWEAPRSLLLAVLPTALRRLESQWAGEEPSPELVRTRVPLKEFIVGNLFDDLMAPEVQVRIPSSDQNQEFGSEPMPQIRSLREFMPGNVTRHFGGSRKFRGRRHWVPLPDDQQPVNVEEVYKATYLGEVPDPTGSLTPLYRPLEVTLVEPPSVVRDYSTVSPIWQVHLAPLTEGRPVDLGKSGWSQIRLEAIVHTHGTGGGARIRRYAHSARGHLVEGQEVSQIHLEFNNGDDRQVALGFELDVDALCLCLHVPPADDPPDHLERSDRQARLLEEADLPSVLGPSRRSALLSALNLVLAEMDEDRAQSFSSLNEGDLSRLLVGALVRLGMSNLNEVDDLPQGENEEEGEDGDADETAFSDLGQWCRNSAVLAVLRSAAECSWQPDRDDRWEAWRHQRLAHTVAAIWVEAACRVCPDIDSNDLIVDVDPRRVHEPDDRSIEVWVSETAPGGNGQIELLHRELSSDPIRFLRFLERVLQPSDIELLDSEIRQVIDLLVVDNEVRSLTRLLRDAWGHSHEAVRTAFESLKAELRTKGLDPRRVVWITLMSRVLAPGADPDLPGKILELLRGWDTLEEDLCLEVDPATFVATIPEDDPVTAVFRLPEDTELARRNRTIGNFFWLRERRASQAYRSAANLFGLLPSTDVASLRSLVIRESNRLNADELGPDRFREIQEELAEHGVVDVVVPAKNADQVRRFLVQSQVEPVDFGALHLYPRVMGLSRTDGRITLRIALEEVASLRPVREPGT